MEYSNSDDKTIEFDPEGTVPFNPDITMEIKLPEKEFKVGDKVLVDGLPEYEVVGFGPGMDEIAVTDVGGQISTHKIESIKKNLN